MESSVKTLLQEIAQWEHEAIDTLLAAGIRTSSFNPAGNDYISQYYYWREIGLRRRQSKLEEPAKNYITYFERLVNLVGIDKEDEKVIKVLLVLKHLSNKDVSDFMNNITDICYATKNGDYKGHNDELDLDVKTLNSNSLRVKFNIILEAYQKIYLVLRKKEKAGMQIDEELSKINSYNEAFKYFVDEIPVANWINIARSSECMSGIGQRLLEDEKTSFVKTKMPSCGAEKRY